MSIVLVPCVTMSKIRDGKSTVNGGHTIYKKRFLDLLQLHDGSGLNDPHRPRLDPTPGTEAHSSIRMPRSNQLEFI